MTEVNRNLPHTDEDETARLVNQEPGTQINAGMEASQRNIPVAEGQRIQFVVQPNDTPWLFFRNLYGKPNLSNLINAAYHLIAMILILNFLKTKDANNLVYILYVDIVLNAVSVVFCFTLQHHYLVIDRNRSVCVEVVAIITKIAMAVALQGVASKGMGSWSALTVQLGYFVLLVLACLRTHIRCYDSFIDEKAYLLVSFTLVLLMFKLSPGSTMDWSTVFIMCTITGYFLFAILALVLTLIICAFVVLTLSGAFSFFFVAISTLLLAKFSEAMLLIGLYQMALPKEKSWVGDIHTLVLMYGIMNIVSLIVNAAGSQYLNLERLLEKAENKIGKVPGSGQIMNLVQVSPTYYTIGDAQPAQGGDKPEGQPEDAECLICCENKSNCIILDCNHGGVCSGCAEESLKKNPNCIICRNPIQKICVVEKQEGNKFKVVQNIFIDK